MNGSLTTRNEAPFKNGSDELQVKKKEDFKDQDKKLNLAEKISLKSLSVSDDVMDMEDEFIHNIKIMSKKQ